MVSGFLLPPARWTSARGEEGPWPQWGRVSPMNDGLAALVQNMLREDPFSGMVFVFRAKRADRLKLLYWDGSGLVMACHAA